MNDEIDLIADLIEELRGKLREHEEKLRRTEATYLEAIRYLDKVSSEIAELKERIRRIAAE